jgi:hypothetical protein
MKTPMKARPELLLAATLTIAAASALVWWRAGIRHERESSWQALQRKQANLQLQVNRKEQMATALLRERDQLRTELADQSSAAGAPRLHKPVETYTPAQAEEMLRFFLTPWQDLALRNDPALRLSYLASERANLDARYGPLVAQLGLSPERAARFKDLLAEHTQELLEIRLAALPGGAVDSKTDFPSRDTADEHLRAAQAELLGDAGYQQLQQYERLMPVRSEIDTLAGSLALTETPLGSGQAAQLLQIIANASSGYQKGGEADAPMPGNGELLTPLMLAHQSIPENIDWNSVLSQARTVLSPDQFELFSNQVGRNQTVVRLYNLIHDYPGDPMVGFTFGRR